MHGNMNVKLYTNTELYSGLSLLADLNFQSVSGLYKNFTRLSPIEYEFLINLIGGEKNLEKRSRRSGKTFLFRKDISVQERHFCSGKTFLFRKDISVQERHFCSGKTFLFKKDISVQERHFCSGKTFLFRKDISVQERHFCSRKTFLFKKG